VVSYILGWQTGGAPETVPEMTATTRPKIEPIPEVEGDPNNGATLYDFNCAVCHGTDGEGRIGATLTQNWGAIRPDLAIRSTIANGGPGALMPAWSQESGGPLTESEIDDIVAFVMSWSAPSDFETPSPEAPISPFWSGWGGAIFTLLAFMLVVVLIFIFQSRQQTKE
jgi:mono/diheme cytochrome c family protein